jgi:periplasmic copper chaperone A
MAIWQATRILVLLGVSILLAGCGGSGAVEASGVWARESPGMAPNTAFYMELHNNSRSEDALVGVQSALCSRVEIHESALDENGVMRMAPVPGGRIPLPAGSHVVLAPGGLPLMCLGIAAPFVAGESVPLVLEFAEHPPLAVEAEIRRDAP